jgi:HSP20 family molecular chaperone IbpA
MLFASTHPALRRDTFAPTSRSLERFLTEARAQANPPGTHYRQDDTAFHITLDVPGVAREQLAISIEGAVVRISSREGAARQYRAAYELPQEIDAGSSEAKLENGVLSLKLTKKLPVNNATEITIQ